MANKVKQAEKLIKDIDKKIFNWNERSQFTMKGVKNLSRGDLDEIQRYANYFIKNSDNVENYGFESIGVMNPMGSLKEVLTKYEII